MTEQPRRLGTWLLSGVALAASLAFLGLRLAVPGDGTTIPFYSDAWGTDGIRVRLLPGPETGLRDDDVITAVAGVPLAAWIDGAATPGLDRSALDGPAVAYTVRRDGAPANVPATFAGHEVGGLLADYWSALLFTVVLQVVAGYVLWRRPGASAAVALAIAAVGVTGSTIPWLLGLQVSDIARGAPFLLYAATAGGLYMLLWPAGALHLLLAMTTAQPPSRRTLAAIYGVPLAAYAATLAARRLSAPSAVAWVGEWGEAQGSVILPTVIVGLGLIVLRWRSAPPQRRRETSWVAVAGSVSLLVSLALFFGPQLLTGRPLVPWSAIGLAALPLPLGVAAAILRRRLFDIEIVVNRALVYGGATVAIGVIYVVTVSLITTLLHTDAGPAGTLLATGLAAVAALPIRDALQGIVNRLMYGDRDDPYRAIIRLGRRLEATLDPLEAPGVIVRTVAESLRLPWVALRVGGGSEPGRLTVHGGPPPVQPLTVPLVYGAEVVGDLRVAPRAASEPLTAADRKLLDDLARQIGAAVHALGLTLDLIASRERLVAAREEERRRIRRDLHDGLGPTLAGIGLRAEVAADLAGHDPAAAQRLLEEMRAEVRGALGDIRRLVDDLRPPALDELGLVGALRAQAAHLGPEPAIDIQATAPLPELPAAVEVAAYRIAVEAMTNAARHAGAAGCQVRIGVVGGRGRSGDAGRSGEGAGPRVLQVEVTDDGLGIPAGAGPGIGLISMRERAAEIGGSCVVEPADGGGTRVLARLPLDGSAAAAAAPPAAGEIDRG